MKSALAALDTNSPGAGAGNGATKPTAPAVATPTRIGDSEARGARLWEAAERRDVSAISRELEGGAYVDYAGRSQWTALHRAADRGWLDILRILIQAYAPTLSTPCSLAAFALAA